MPPSVATEIAAYAHGRVPRELRERQLLELAEQLFAERGYAAASMDELARRAGVSKPVIYDLVGSKGQLFRAVSEGVRRQLAERVAAAVLVPTDPAEQLRAGGLAFFRFAAEHRPMWELLFSEGFADEAARFRARQAELIAGLIDAIVRATGMSVPRRKVEIAAHTLNGAFEAVAHWSLEHKDVSPEELADAVVELMGPGLRLLTGLDPASPLPQEPQ